MYMNNRRKNITVLSRMQNLDKVVAELVNFVAGNTTIKEDAIELAVTEAVANAIIHGNKSDPRKKVHAHISINPQQITLQIADEGLGFDYKKLADPTKQENLYKQGGRGIFFIQYFMDEVKFNRTGNEITMIKYVN